jgi:Spy/CpxP family protein refolding chaperone
MTRHYRFAVLCAFVLALTHSSPSFARKPFDGPDSHRDPGAFIEKKAEALGLDEEKLAAIRSIVESSKETGDRLHSEVRGLHDEMKEMLSQDAPDEAAVMKQIDGIGAVEVEMHKHRVRTMLKIRELLTPQQREAMVKLREDTRGRWKHALREACEEDLARLCPDAGDRRERRHCLEDNRKQVSSECRDAVGDARRARRESHRGPPEPEDE